MSANLAGQMPDDELLERKRMKLLGITTENNGQGLRGAPEQDCNSALPVCSGTFYQPSAYSDRN
ncbi:MAG: hypothetical protein R2728_05600 [Chitinophagales bacterium]